MNGPRRSPCLGDPTNRLRRPSAPRSSHGPSFHVIYSAFSCKQQGRAQLRAYVPPRLDPQAERCYDQCSRTEQIETRTTSFGFRGSDSRFNMFDAPGGLGLAATVRIALVGDV